MIDQEKYAIFREFREDIEKKLTAIDERNEEKQVKDSAFDHLNDSIISEDWDVQDNFELERDKELFEVAIDVVSSSAWKGYEGIWGGHREYSEALLKCIPVDDELAGVIESLEDLISSCRAKKRKKNESDSSDVMRDLFYQGLMPLLHKRAEEIFRAP